jgi:small ligand-binding sensory domain FIST
LGQLSDQAYTSFLNGGLTSSQGENYQLVNRVVSGGVSGVLFNERVEVLTDHTQGCSPIGPVHRLTDAHRNLAFRIDNRPALEVLKEDVGDVLSRDLTQAAGYIFTALPIPGSDTGDYLVRNLIGIDEENGLIAVGDYLEGQSQLMFCRRDGNSAREDMLRMLGRLKARLGERRIRGGIYVSCLGRGRHQFGPNSEELKLIESELGSFPLVGFFANGEIYNGRLYGYTGVLTLFV